MSASVSPQALSQRGHSELSRGGNRNRQWSTRIARNDMIKLLFKNNPEKPPEIEELGEEGVGTVQMCVGVSADPFAVRNYYPPRGRFLTWA
ncbi:hypothetical protein quinque_003147 [Culex quinquefasciatus]